MQTADEQRDVDIPEPDQGAVSPSELSHRANVIRLTAMLMNHHSQLGHTGGDLSAADILAVLYLGRVLRVDPARPDWAERDRFIMSKGHCSAAFYTTLATRGFFPQAALSSFMDPLSQLNGHPDRNKVRGVEANTGPLGHGLPIGVGCALAAKMQGASWRVFVLTGDGELQEGSNWEAAMTAQHYGLDNLVVIVDRNHIQQGDFTEDTIRMEPLAERWRAFGFETAEIDGHDHEDLLQHLQSVPLKAGKPTCFIAKTIKGKGVSFAEGIPAWHHGIPTVDELHKASVELGVSIEETKGTGLAWPK